MSDLIDRQAAIDATWAEPLYTDALNVLTEVRDRIKALPSAQPELPFEIQDILNYLDTALHPIISPEHWNVYSELHDMISTLPSAQQEQCEFCKNRGLEDGDTLYISADWDGGIGFDFIRDIHYCPKCGRRLVK